MTQDQKFPKLVYRIAGIYGLLITLPQYFAEKQFGIDYPPPINHPEFYYGFIGLIIAWQVMFLFISMNPAKYRQLIVPCVIEKIVFPFAIYILYAQSRVPGLFVGLSSIDLLLAVLFVVAYFKTPKE